MSGRRAKRIPAWRDTLLYLLGLGMIAHQAFIVKPADFNWVIMAAGGVLAGVPGWLQLWGLRTTPTELSPSSSPEEPLPPPLPSSPST